MYQLVKSFVKDNQRHGVWREADLGAVPVATLMAQYADVILVITYPALQGTVVHFKLSQVANLLVRASAVVTTTQWLTELGNQSLPTTPGEPNLSKRFVKYTQAWHNGYQIEPVDRGERIDIIASKHDKADLLVTHPEIDPVTLRKGALFSVNGYFHFAEYGEQGVYIHEGNTSVRLANDNQIGVHSFTNVGEINYLDITDDMISNLKVGAPLVSGTYVTLPDDFDFQTQTVLLVIGGYLQVLDKTYTRVGMHTYKIELTKMMLIERYFESKRHIDFSAVDFTLYEDNYDLVTVSEWFSDHAVRTLMGLSQSFLVIVNTPSMFQELIPVESLALPGRFRDSEYAQYPLLGAYGKALEYHSIEEDGQFVIASQDTLRHNYDFTHRPWMDSPAFNSGRNSYLPFTHTDTYWRLIGTQE